MTNIVARTTRSAAELSKKEIADGKDATVEMIARLKPLVVCFNGKGGFARLKPLVVCFNGKGGWFNVDWKFILKGKYFNGTNLAMVKINSFISCRIDVG